MPYLLGYRPKVCKVLPMRNLNIEQICAALSNSLLCNEYVEYDEAGRTLALGQAVLLGSNTITCQENLEHVIGDLHDLEQGGQLAHDALPDLLPGLLEAFVHQRGCAQPIAASPGLMIRPPCLKQKRCIQSWQRPTLTNLYFV